MLNLFKNDDFYKILNLHKMKKKDRPKKRKARGRPKKARYRGRPKKRKRVRRTKKNTPLKVMIF